MTALTFLADSKISRSLASRNPNSFNENALTLKLFVTQIAKVGGY